MPDYQETIVSCSRMLVGNTDVGGAGQGRQINAPLVSIFLGRDAEAHMEDVSSTYQSCWFNGAKALKYLDSQTYSPDRVLEVCQAMLAVRHAFRNYATLHLAYFWDIMDDRFDVFWEAVKHPLSFPTAITVEPIFFIFCRELAVGAKERKEQRLKALTAWASENNQHLVVLSDFSIASGLLGPDGISENYRLAANVLLISNTYTPPGENDLGRDLRFFLRQKPVHTAGYYILKKNTWDIATVCLWQILDDYQRLPQAAPNGQSVKERLCRAQKGYDGLFQELFGAQLNSLLPQDHSFLRYLPYTDAVRQLDDHLNGVQHGFSFFGRRNNANQGVNQELASNAISSIQPFWESCLERYYRRPVFTWLDSEAGAALVRESFRQKLNLALNYEEMSNLLLQEADELEKLARSRTWNLPEISEKMPLADWFHLEACRELMSAIFCRLAQILASSMREMHSAAQGFDRVLSAAKDNLQVQNTESSVRTSYINKTHNLLAANRDLLARKISPCADESTLLQQARDVFAELVNIDPVYQLSLKDHYNFLISSSTPADVDNIIAACFNQNMNEISRLQTYTPPGGDAKMYCMVSHGNFEERIDPHLHGSVFHMPRNDCIERLLVYPIDPETIIY